MSRGTRSVIDNDVVPDFGDSVGMAKEAVAATFRKLYPFLVKLLINLNSRFLLLQIGPTQLTKGLPLWEIYLIPARLN